jgi:predicted site-specific integrase-resolvase
MKLSQWAKQKGLTYRGAYNHFKKGKISGAYQLSTGTIIVPEEDANTSKSEWNVVYARVSNSENRSNLESQADRVSMFCAANGWVVHQIVKECASGLNDKRPKLQKIMKERNATRLLVEHKDRLTRFGFEYIKTLWPECEVVVINEAKEDEEDLMADFVALVTSFCARLYGKRRSKRNTEKLIREMQKDSG